MAKYKITYLKDTFENTEDTPVMDLNYWTNLAPCSKAKQIINDERPDLLESQIVEYPGEPMDDDWQDYQYDVLHIMGDIVDWEEA